MAIGSCLIGLACFLHELHHRWCMEFPKNDEARFASRQIARDADWWMAYTANCIWNSSILACLMISSMMALSSTVFAVL